ncbi:MAG: hypothetical protein VYB30_01520 [Candidatus Thermoplasmatota archaeon]|nr:hypothetical protein [Candidatus Thermoplasmatota archaeon]
MVDVILRLIDSNALGRLRSMSLEQLVLAFESGRLGDERPAGDPRFHRSFSVDIEGDFLEWADKSNGQLDADASLILCDWSSVAEWRCWDGRLFLYIEPLLEQRFEDADEFLNTDVWQRFTSELSTKDRESYSESVILDWMQRREGLGDTLNPDEDPRILPTMESHKSLTESLFDFIELSKEEGLTLLIGREYLEPKEWVLDGEKLAEVVA